MGSSSGGGVGSVALGTDSRTCCSEPRVAKAAPNLDVNATPSVSVPADACVLLVDPNLAGLLEKVAGLKEHLSGRQSLGGLLADKAAKRAGNRYRKREDHSR